MPGSLMKLNIPMIAPEQIRTFATACFFVLMASLIACGKKDENQTVGQQLDAAVDKMEQAAKIAKTQTEATVAKAAESLKEETRKAEEVGLKSAKSVAAKVDDMVITAAISKELAKDPELSALQINVETENSKVTLNGHAPTAATREKASAIAKSIKDVTAVDNKVVVKPN